MPYCRQTLIRKMASLESPYEQSPYIYQSGGGFLSSPCPMTVSRVPQSQRCQKSYHGNNWLVAAKRSQRRRFLIPSMLTLPIMPKQTLISVGLFRVLGYSSGMQRSRPETQTLLQGRPDNIIEHLKTKSKSVETKHFSNVYRLPDSYIVTEPAISAPIYLVALVTLEVFETAACASRTSVAPHFVDC